MRVEVYFTHSGIDESVVKDKTVAVVDVLRVCTTVAYAYSRGCERIIPVESIEAATNLASSLDKKVTLLGGEKEGRRIDGFDLGNSPSEYTSEIVKGKTLILATTNGTRAITKSREATEVVIASFVNMSAVANHLKKAKDVPVAIVCSGKQGKFALEDAVCAGMLVERVGAAGDAEFNDAGVAAGLLYRKNEKRIPDVIRNCQHGKYLASIGFEEDLEICASVDSLKTLPIVKEGRIDRHKRRRRG